MLELRDTTDDYYTQVFAIEKLGALGTDLAGRWYRDGDTGFNAIEAYTVAHALADKLAAAGHTVRLRTVRTSVTSIVLPHK